MSEVGTIAQMYASGSVRRTIRNEPLGTSEDIGLSCLTPLPQKD